MSNQPLNGNGKRMDWSLIWAALGVMVSMVLVASAIIVSHVSGVVAVEQAERDGTEKVLSQILTSQEKLQERMEAKSERNSESIVGIERKLEEIETQFYWSGDADAGERADNDRLVRMLWKREYGEELPAKNIYNRGPQRAK